MDEKRKDEKGTNVETGRREEQTARMRQTEDRKIYSNKQQIVE